MQRLFATHVFKRLSLLIKRAASSLSSFSDQLKLESQLNAEVRKILARNGVFKNKHIGKRAFVILDEKNLHQQNLELIKNEIKFIGSNAPKEKGINKEGINYYNIFSDSDSYEKSGSLVKEDIFFISIFDSSAIESKNAIQLYENVFYILLGKAPGGQSDITQMTQAFQGAGAFALNQAIFMGCSPIYLLGFDHDLLADNNPSKKLTEIEFAGNKIYKGKDQTPDIHSYDGQIMAYHTLWQNYRSLNAVAKKKDIKIYNATIGGYLDVFERIHYEYIFRKD